MAIWLLELLVLCLVVRVGLDPRSDQLLFGYFLYYTRDSIPNVPSKYGQLSDWIFIYT